MTKIFVLCSLPLFVLLGLGQEEQAPAPKTSMPDYSIPVANARTEIPSSLRLSRWRAARNSMATTA